MDDPVLRDWLSRAAAGDRFALQKLIVAHHGRLRRVAADRLSRDLRSRVDPEDLLQQVYGDVVDHMRGFVAETSGAFFAWLVRILEAKLVDIERFHRARVRNVRREVSPPESVAGREALLSRVGLVTSTPSRIASREEGRALLQAALATLPPDYRRVLELRFLEGRSAADLAPLMKRSVAAVQMLTTRALRQLKRSIGRLSRIGL